MHSLTFLAGTLRRSRRRQRPSSTSMSTCSKRCGESSEHGGKAAAPSPCHATNQPMHQSTNQPTSQPANQSINQPNDQTHHSAMKQPRNSPKANKYTDALTSQPANQLTDLSTTNQPPNKRIPSPTGLGASRGRPLRHPPHAAVILPRRPRVGPSVRLPGLLRRVGPAHARSARPQVRRTGERAAARVELRAQHGDVWHPRQRGAGRGACRRDARSRGGAAAAPAAAHPQAPDDAAAAGQRVWRRAGRHGRR
eukprot:359919-Chlamydomonas_euryale.AAC.14